MQVGAASVRLGYWRYYFYFYFAARPAEPLAGMT